MQLKGRRKPISVTVTVNPRKLSNNNLVGEKLQYHCTEPLYKGLQIKNSNFFSSRSLFSFILLFFSVVP